MAPTIRAAGGLCVPPSNPDALATALSRYLEKTPEALTELGEQAYQYVRANHGIADYRAAYLRLVRQVLARRQ